MQTVGIIDYISPPVAIIGKKLELLLPVKLIELAKINIIMTIRSHKIPQWNTQRPVTFLQLFSF